MRRRPATGRAVLNGGAPWSSDGKPEPRSWRLGERFPKRMNRVGSEPSRMMRLIRETFTGSRTGGRRTRAESSRCQLSAKDHHVPSPDIHRLRAGSFVAKETMRSWPFQFTKNAAQTTTARASLNGRAGRSKDGKSEQCFSGLRSGFRSERTSRLRRLQKYPGVSAAPPPPRTCLVPRRA